MNKICLQAGHENVAHNSIQALRRNSGAPGELEFNVDIRNQLAARLRELGFEVKTTDANANDDKSITGADWDMFLSLHYDAAIYQSGGGFVAFPKPETDYATAESQRIAKAMEEEYFPTTGIVNHPERRNANTDYFYMWKYLSKKTPCVLIECGVGMHVPDDHSTLHFNRPLVVKGLAKGICKAFGVAYKDELQDDPYPDSIPTEELLKEHLELLQKEVSGLSQKLGNIEASVGKWQSSIELANKALKSLENTIGSYQETTVTCLTKRK